MVSSKSTRLAFALLLGILSLLSPVLTADTTTKYATATIDGKQVAVPDNRRPALYTGKFGDCMGGSSINVTRFDAAYYKDNMTILFHLGGDSALKNESIMMYIGVYAYGESRFDLTFNPCSANIYSACPVRAGTPIQANGVIPVSPTDVAGIPSIALSIPDFEGEAILRIFANSTQSEIGCFSAIVTNGNTFAQAPAVGSVLGIFTFVAVISSFATAIYGDSIPVMRKHYAHSLSVLVVFSVWHHIYFSGALSMNWPSVLVAFWSNYAWAGGMIYAESMQNTINQFIGSNKGNTSAVGAAGTGVQNLDLGGGYDIHKIYRRDIVPRALNVSGLMKRSKYNRVARHVENLLTKRELADASNGFSWYGSPVKPGLPLPGNYSGFAGTLSEQNIPASNAFMTGFLWFLVLLTAVASMVVAFKFTLDGLSKTKLIKSDRLAFFRAHYLGFTALAVLRTMFIGFFMLIFLCLFQFTYLASPGPVAVACIVFLIMLIGLGGLAGYACFYRIKFGNYISEPDRLHLEKKKVMKVIPWYGFARASDATHAKGKASTGSMPWWRVRTANESEKSIHDDEDYIKKFGWLASRFRRTRWWFFVVWLVYEFIRACFLAGASGQPMVQVFGLLVVEFIAFIGIIIARPFEGQRLNLIVVYMLGFSKVATVALSAAFDTRWNLPRIPATVIGIVIIVIQGALTIVMLIAIVSGAISSYMSVMRDREEIRPKTWNPIREKYFTHMDFKAKDIPRPPPPPPEPVPEVPKSPYFSVNSIKRVAKIEDEDVEFQGEIQGGIQGEIQDGTRGEIKGDGINTSQTSLPGGDGVGEMPGRSRAASIQSQMSYSSLPYGARVHRASWNAHDFVEQYAPGRRRTPSNPMRYTPEDYSRPVSRTPLSALNTSIPDSLGSRTLGSGMPPVEYGIGSTASPINRLKSRPTSSTKSPMGSRTQLDTLPSEGETPSLPQTGNARKVADTDAAM